jgi:hypothetical protein
MKSAAQEWDPMSRQSPRRNLLIAVAAAVVLFQPGCSKWNHFVEYRRAEKRIAQIDAQLARWVPTGRVEDADARAALRAEKARLAKQFGLKTSDSELAAQTVAISTPVQTPVPAPTAGANKTVIAPAPLNSLEEADPEKLRQLNITSAGGHFDQRTGRVEPNSTPWREAEKR